MPQLHAIVPVPVMLPVVLGANKMDSCTVCRGAKVIGRVGPTKLKVLFDMLICASTKFVLSVLLTVTGMVELLPTWTLPKLRL